MSRAAVRRGRGATARKSNSTHYSGTQPVFNYLDCSNSVQHRGGLREGGATRSLGRVVRVIAAVQRQSLTLTPDATDVGLVFVLSPANAASLLTTYIRAARFRALQYCRYTSIRGRVVKASHSKSDFKLKRTFESYRLRFSHIIH